MTRFGRLAIGLAGLAMITACQAHPVVKTGADPGTAAPAGGGKSSAKPVAHVGDTINLAGNGDGEKVAVKIVKVADPARGSDFYSPDKGNRFVAVQFKLTNVGTAAYDDSPSNGAVVVDADGQRFDATIADVTAGPSMDSGLKMAAGDSALGYIVFEVPKASKLRSVQFTLDSGFAEETGQWQLP